MRFLLTALLVMFLFACDTTTPVAVTDVSVPEPVKKEKSSGELILPTGFDAAVQTIQADTSEAVSSMESTTSEVVSGTRLAEDAGTALVSIENESNQLSKLINDIAADAHEHAGEATSISELIQNIRDISMSTSVGSQKTAGAVDELAELVLQLRESVADFKLPESDQ